MTDEHNRAEMERLRARKRQAKQEYAGLYQRLTALFFELDPVGINLVVNSDEYEMEIGTILPRLKEAGSVTDVARILDEELDHWFGTTTHRVGVERLAAAVWEMWCNEGGVRSGE